MALLFSHEGHFLRAELRSDGRSAVVRVSPIAEPAGPAGPAEDLRRRSPRISGVEYTLDVFRNFFHGANPLLWATGEHSLLNTIVDPSWAVEIAVAPNDKGRGVFATMYIAKGTYVMSMGETTRGLPPADGLALPHDSIIHDGGGGVYHDAAFVRAFREGNVATGAPWYYLNHCNNGGGLVLVFKYDILCWQTTKDIHKGDELIFRYSNDEATKALNRCRCPLCMEVLRREFRELIEGPDDDPDEVQAGFALLFDDDE